MEPEVLAQEIQAFEQMRAHLEATSLGRWTLIHETTLVATFQDFESAASEAVKQFGRGPYLIRQIGVSDITLPASIFSNSLMGCRAWI